MTRRLKTVLLRERWWLCVPVALLCVVLVDMGLTFWQPKPQRLPEQFSSAYLQRYVSAYRASRPVVFVGDSVLWGHRLRPEQAAASITASSLHQPSLNMSYEGGSSVNTYFVLRYLLSTGVKPRLVLFNVNSKESNSLDSAYRRLHPSLEQLVAPLFDSEDRQLLALQPAKGLPQRLDAAVASVWKLYRYRTDIREAIFGTDDAATALKNFAQAITGSAKLQAAVHVPTPDRFFGTYDVSPLTPDNVDLIYLKKTAQLLRDQRISAVAFLTPTNHRLLHGYIDFPQYDARLRQIAGVLHSAPDITVLNLDKAIPYDEFFDNDHLTITGNRRLASILARAAQRSLSQ